MKTENEQLQAGLMCFNLINKLRYAARAREGQVRVSADSLSP